MDISIEHRLTAVEDKADNNEHRLEELEKRQDNLDDLVSTVKVLVVREEQVENDVKEIKSDVKSLTSKPGQRWDKLMDNIFWGIVGAVLAFLLAKIGL
jgi:hypothetical protein